MLSGKVWAKGMAAALIGGGASAVAAAVTAVNEQEDKG